MIFIYKFIYIIEKLKVWAIFPFKDLPYLRDEFLYVPPSPVKSHCHSVVQVGISLFLDHPVIRKTFWYFIISDKITFIESLLHTFSTFLASSPATVILRFSSISSSAFFTVRPLATTLCFAPWRGRCRVLTVILYTSDSQTVRRGIFTVAPRRRRILPGLKISLNTTMVATVKRRKWLGLYP